VFAGVGERHGLLFGVEHLKSSAPGRSAGHTGGVALDGHDAVSGGSEKPARVMPVGPYPTITTSQLAMSLDCTRSPASSGSSIVN
jgi:hypothetical protein